MFFSGKGYGCRKWRGKFLMSGLVSNHKKCELGQKTTSYWNQGMLFLIQSMVC